MGAPCNRGERNRAYEGKANLRHATKPHGYWSPSASSHGIHSVRFVQAPSASVISGVVTVNGTAHLGDTYLPPRVIAVVCISVIAILLFFLFMSEVITGVFRSQWCQRTSALNRQTGHDDEHARAAPEENDAADVPEVAQSGQSPETASTEAAGTDDSQVRGLKQGLACWVIKGLPVLKYKKLKYKKQPFLHGRCVIGSSSASFVECLSCGIAPCGSRMMAMSEVNHDNELASAASARHNPSRAPDHSGPECVVCLCPFEEDDDVRVLPRCSHEFHMACIDSWLVLHSTCPLCRMQVSPLDWVEPAEANHIFVDCSSIIAS